MIVTPHRLFFSSHVLPKWGLWSLIAFGCLLGTGCDTKESDLSQTAPSPEIAPGLEAFQAAQRLVGLSLRPSGSTTITFGQPKRDPETGYEMQDDGSWQTWGWVDLPEVSGPPERVYWLAVMHHLGEGRKWRASWLKIGDQESGMANQWKGPKP